MAEPAPSTESTPLLASNARAGAPPGVTFVAQQVAPDRRGSRSGAVAEAAVDQSTENPVADSGKLDTYEGVFIPTTLNVLSILMFLRFGFIIGQAGVLGSLLLLALSYAINVLTTLSISAIATNGTVRGGGAYYMISRSLGPEFGGSIGIIFYVGQVLNAGLNVVGFADPLLANFGRNSGEIAKILPETYWWAFTYETILLLLCTVICLVGPSMFARSSKMLFYILIAATISVPISALIVPRYWDEHFGAWYTGLSFQTLWDNMLPRFTQGAAGSDNPGTENFRDLFGVFFPATAGILAGASMSGDLKTPSKSIPRGTIAGIAVTIVLYASVIFSVAATTSRDLLYADVDIIRDINYSPVLVMLGEFATSIFSALMGILGAAKLLQAVSRDQIVPFIGVFGQGTKDTDNPLLAILFTFLLTQLTIFLNVNQIAVFITMAFLMTFVVTNFACFLLEIASAPNFRPSFVYFNATTAGAGSLCCILAMVGADGWAASFIVLTALSLFLIIHFYTPPKAWGDVSQALIYHQVRKYLLRLRQDHVKYWRPQVLLLVDDPRSCLELLQFCNSLKKGGLFILGHVVISKDFKDDFAEVSKQRSAWAKLRDTLRIKAFVQVCASPDIVWGARNIYLNSGLGGMRPNITVVGFYGERNERDQSREHQRTETVDIEALPTDSCRTEVHVSCQEWVQMLEDMVTMGTNIAVAKGFLGIDLPERLPLFKMPKVQIPKRHKNREYKFIDLYPIQMSAKLVDHESGGNAMSINLDTYTLILQLGAILHTVKSWYKAHRLRVVAFVEHSDEIPEETERLSQLLGILRIPATLLVKVLDTDNYAYDVIVKGMPDSTGEISQKLASSKWWQRLCKSRKNPPAPSRSARNMRPSASNQQARYMVPGQALLSKKRRSLSYLEQMGVAHSLGTSRWNVENMQTFYDDNSDTSDSGTSGDEDSDANEQSFETVEHVGRGDTPIFDGHPLTALDVNRGDVDDHKDANMTAPPDPEEYIDPNEEPDSDGGEDPLESAHDMKFNHIPAKAQHLVLNHLMRATSQDASVIFSTLPPPALGTHVSEKVSKDYYDLIEAFTEGLPPTLLILSQSMTVTTAL